MPPAAQRVTGTSRQLQGFPSKPHCRVFVTMCSKRQNKVQFGEGAAMNAHQSLLVYINIAAAHLIKEHLYLQ